LCQANLASIGKATAIIGKFAIDRHRRAEHGPFGAVWFVSMVEPSTAMSKKFPEIVNPRRGSRPAPTLATQDPQEPNAILCS
jgi:hypothetical protein